MTIKAAPLKDENSKVHPDPTSNTEKNPDDWVSGEEAHKPDAFDSSLTKADASKRIDALKARLAKD